MPAPRYATWRDYPVELVYPSGRESTGWVRAISRRHAIHLAMRKYGSVANWRIGEAEPAAGAGDPEDLA